MVVSIFFIFTPKLGEDEPILTNIFFKRGWFNHQLAFFGQKKNMFFLLVDLDKGFGDDLGDETLNPWGLPPKQQLANEYNWWSLAS